MVLDANHFPRIINDGLYIYWLVGKDLKNNVEAFRVSNLNIELSKRVPHEHRVVKEVPNEHRVVKEGTK